MLMSTVRRNIGTIVPAAVAALAIGRLDRSGQLVTGRQLNGRDDVELGKVDGLVAAKQLIHLGRNGRLDLDLLAL